MKRAICRLIILCLGLLSTAPALAQDPIVFPANGQSQDQMERDKFECYSWAKNQTGFDPMQPPTATSAPPPQEAKVGGVGRGAARGAAVGVVGGAIGGNARRGVRVGAASGALVGGMRRRDQTRRQQQAQEQWAQQQAANYNNMRNQYNRAHAACLEGKGYTVR